MNINLNFKNIIDNPQCRVYINNTELYSGVVLPKYEFNIDVALGNVMLLIDHWGKLPQDTVVDRGVIVRDRSFELESIVIDHYNLEELIWDSEFRAIDGAVYPSCLFFGPNGQFVLNFENPVLRWQLRRRHEKNNNDPHWEQDYNFYTNACKRLTQILPK
jgi:hypothetical protein